MYRTYNEFYVLLEQIYSGEYFKNQQNGDNSGSGIETPNTGTAIDGEAEAEAECIELDTFEQPDDNNDTNDTDDDK